MALRSALETAEKKRLVWRKARGFERKLRACDVRPAKFRPCGRGWRLCA